MTLWNDGGFLMLGLIARPFGFLLSFFYDILGSYAFAIIALSALVGELNGTSDARISSFVLDMLENGSSLELVGDMMANIQAHKTKPEELDALLEKYKKARAASKEA